MSILALLFIDPKPPLGCLSTFSSSRVFLGECWPSLVRSEEVWKKSETWGSLVSPDPLLLVCRLVIPVLHALGCSGISPQSPARLLCAEEVLEFALLAVTLGGADPVSVEGLRNPGIFH